MPISAKALFRAIDSQLASPASIPGSEPMLRSMKKYVPPLRGMAVASSALAIIAGSISTPAKA